MILIIINQVKVTKRGYTLSNAVHEPLISLHFQRTMMQLSSLTLAEHFDIQGNLQNARS